MTQEQLLALVPPLAALVTWGVKWVMEKWSQRIPKVVWPLLCGMLGPGGDWLMAQMTAGETWGWKVGILLGLAGVGVREVANQLSKVSPKPGE